MDNETIKAQVYGKNCYIKMVKRSGMERFCHFRGEKYDGVCS